MQLVIQSSYNMFFSSLHSLRLANSRHTHEHPRVRGHGVSAQGEFLLPFVFLSFLDSRISRSGIQRARSRVISGVANGRDRTRERHSRAGSACARARKFGITGRTGRAARQAADTPFSRDNTPTLASTSTTGAERARANEPNERTWNERRERNTAPKDLGGAPRISNRVARAIYVPQGCLKERS